ncbi:hypothetical protein C2L64_44405 [Paraburkholderia hospita]|uniref:Shufflon system plasmid conjugative transfer pilus tip adhesin PilV n=2 Tax=Paraburkholderia hospita TaxID=169430 RepID=A0AAN1JKI4_9BURK|nr:hypothetical protein C2L64_44405 [Paraburkholderia hospita]
MAIVLLAAAIMTVVGIKQDVAKQRAGLLAAEGQSEARINDALSKWSTDNYSTLLAQYTSSGSATLTAPSIDDLHTQGYLKTAFRDGPFWGGTYQIDMTMVPAGCTADAGNCHVSYRMYTSQPVTHYGQPDSNAASQIAQAGGSDFGYSKLPNPANIVGLLGKWTAVNPVGGSPVGVVLATNGDGGDGDAIYIRRDGSLTWTGDQNVNHVSLHNVHNLDAEGTISAANVGATGAIAASGAVAAGTTVSTGATGWPRIACSTANAMTGATDNSGFMLSCQNVSGVLQWMPVGGEKQWYGYTKILSGGGTFVPAPVCPAGGTPEITVTGQSLYVDPTAAINYPFSGTGPWVVYITDGSGNVIPGTAVASTYCAY